jgi:hypothetical protein
MNQMGAITLMDVKWDIEALAGWANEIRSSIATIPAQTVIVQQTDTWRETPPIIVRPPRTTICFGCIEETKTSVTAGDLVDALTKMQTWLTVLKDDIGRIQGGETA